MYYMMLSSVFKSFIMFQNVPSHEPMNFWMMLNTVSYLDLYKNFIGIFHVYIQVYYSV